MLPDLLIPLMLVGLSELGDKTQLSIFLLSTKTTNRWQLFLGVMLAFFIVDGLAILICSCLTNVIPINTIKIIAGIIFIGLGLLVLRDKETGSKDKLYSRNPFIAGLVLITIAELGDKTQIAAGSLAIKYNWLMVLIGTMIALLILSLMAIYLGKIIGEKINKKVLNKAVGIIFILIGISFIVF